MNAFEKAVRFTLSWEGGYVFDPNDPGGETKYGISKRAYPELDIKNLTEEEAKSIYKKDYWDKLRCDELPENVAIALFDFAVNVGVARAVRYLQRAANKLRSNLVVDGIIGSKTIAAVKSLPEDSLIVEYTTYRVYYYTRLAARGNLARFLRGWLRRTVSLVLFLGSGIR